MARVGLIFVLFTLSSVAQTIPANQAQAESSSSVRKYCADVRRTLSLDTTKLVFGRQCSTEPSESSACTWKQFASEREWQVWTEHEDNADYGAAFVWVRDGRVVQANFTFQTPSYDWANQANYCFRRDGSIAVMSTTLNDLNLDVSVNREAVYSHTGKLLQRMERARKLSTKQATPIPKEVLEAEKSSAKSGFAAPEYRDSFHLPFVDLISR